MLPQKAAFTNRCLVSGRWWPQSGAAASVAAAWPPVRLPTLECWPLSRLRGFGFASLLPLVPAHPARAGPDGLGPVVLARSGACLPACLAVLVWWVAVLVGCRVRPRGARGRGRRLVRPSGRCLSLALSSSLSGGFGGLPRRPLRRLRRPRGLRRCGGAWSASPPPGALFRVTGRAGAVKASMSEGRLPAGRGRLIPGEKRGPSLSPAPSRRRSAHPAKSCNFFPNKKRG